MAFPQTPLPIKQEVLINGVWTDITSRTREDANVDIRNRGQSSEQGNTVSPGSAAFTVNNRDYFFSNRSPSSANYGLIGLNTQYRCSLTEATPWLRMADYSDANGVYDGARADTADKASLDITGDIDIRVDVRPDNWRGGRGTILMAKYNSGTNQRSWVMWIDLMGYLWLRWTTDGTNATAINVQSTATVSALRRQAVRVTLDVNNGSGGYTATFYTSDTISGSWVQLGNQVTTTGGTTSIFSGTSALHVGTIPLGSGVAARGTFSINGGIADPFCGRIYRAQVYNGIGGTLVADMDATAQTPGTTSWSDGLASANTWVLHGSAEISKQNYRFWGELGSVPQEWDVSGTDLYGRITAYDLISRLNQGSKSLHSSIYLNLIRFATLDCYHPMENGSQATRPSPAVGSFGTMTNAIFTTDEDFPGSQGVLSFSSDAGTASGGGLPISSTTSTGVVTLLFYFRAPAVPGSTVNIMNYYLAGGNTYRVVIAVGGANYHLDIYTSDGTSLLTTTVAFGAGASPNQPLAMRLMLTQNGGNVDYEWGWYPVGAPVLYGVSGSYAGTVGRAGGRARTWDSPAFTGKSGWWIAHVATYRENIPWATYSLTNSTNAYVGEAPEDRFARLCIANKIPFWIVGRAYSATLDSAIGERMGPQTAQPLMALLQECAALDRGMLYAPRDKFGLTLRLHNSLLNRECVELDYAANKLSPPFQPRDDPFFVRNDVTVANNTGGSARYTKTSGAYNVNEPADDPQGVGTYDPGPITRIAQDDERLTALAQEEVFLGTWDDLRYPNVTIERARAAYTGDALLDADVLDADLGDALRIVNLPAQLPPDDAELLVVGYGETLRNRGHAITWNTAPYGPYRHLNDLTGSSLARARLAASNSALTSSLTNSATSFSVSTPSGRLWRTGSSAPTFPIEVVIGGEEMAVGQISGSSSPQTFSSVTRSVNGVVKAHDALEAVQVRDAFYIGRDRR